MAISQYTGEIHTRLLYRFHEFARKLPGFYYPIAEWEHNLTIWLPLYKWRPHLYDGIGAWRLIELCHYSDSNNMSC